MCPLIAIAEGIAMNLRGILIIIAIALAMSMGVPGALAAEAEPDEENLGDVDPTKPVVFNVREEFSKLQGDNWRNALILRTDVIKLGGLRNFLLRFDVPFVSSDLGRGTDHGLGDLYGQALLIPYGSESFFFAVGSGLTAPSPRRTAWGQESGRSPRWPYPAGGSRTRRRFSSSRSRIISLLRASRTAPISIT